MNTDDEGDAPFPFRRLSAQNKHRGCFDLFPILSSTYSDWRGGSDIWQIFQFIWLRKSEKLNSLTANTLQYFFVLIIKVGFRLGLRLLVAK